MTTRLAGKSTKYLPFNIGHNKGKGNPSQSGRVPDRVLVGICMGQKIIGWTSSVVFSICRRKNWRTNPPAKYHQETMIFPRFHQLDMVRRLSHDAKAQGAGKNYLIQLPPARAKPIPSRGWPIGCRFITTRDERIFDSVIVITDRLVLD